MTTPPTAMGGGRNGELNSTDNDTVTPRQPQTPIDGAALLDELRDTITKYVVFADKNAPAAVALWITATHCLPAFECAPGW